jgi:hypothetical protein
MSNSLEGMQAEIAQRKELFVVDVRRVNHEEEEESFGQMTFDSEKAAYAWLEAQYDLPGIGGVEYIAGGDRPEFIIHKQQIAWVATIVGGRREILDAPAVYVSDTEKNLHDVVRLQNDVPDDYGLSAWFEDRGEFLHVDSYYIE